MKKLYILFLLTALPIMGFSQNLSPNPTFNGSTDWSDNSPGTSQKYDAALTRTADGSGSYLINSDGTYNSGIRSVNIAQSSVPPGDYLFSYYVYGTKGDKTKPIIRDNGLGQNIQGAAYTILADDTWELVEHTFTMSGSGTVSLRAMVQSNDVTMDFHVDDVSFSKLVTEDSFVTNPDFEASPSILDNWSPSGADITASVVPGNGGGSAGQIFFDAIQVGNKLLDNDKYDFEKTISTSQISTTLDIMSNNTNLEIQILIDYYDENGDKIAGASNNSGTVSVTDANTWQNFTINVSPTVAFNEIQFRLKIRGIGAPLAAANDYVAFDNIVASFSYSTLSVDDVDFKEDINISMYPNPVQNLLKINAPNTIEKIEVYNVLGQKMLDSKGTNQINVESLSKGMYISKIFMEGDVISTKRFFKD